ncbi:hypothetical protein DFJ73DRAFT_843918 [Zopfochytrium polystomum]|nr:hypothetical protein DFJ73DRAFT_843918 [Zopfochytrium polystomum]
MSDQTCPRTFSRSIDASGYWTPLTEPPSSSLPSAMPTPDETAVKRVQASPEGTFKKTKTATDAALDKGSNLFPAMAVSEGGTHGGILEFRPSSTATAADEPRFDTPVSTKEDGELSTRGPPNPPIPTLGESTAAQKGKATTNVGYTPSAPTPDGKGDSYDCDGVMFPKDSDAALEPAAPFNTGIIEKIAAYIEDDDDALEFLRHVDYMQRCAEFEAEFATNVSACGDIVIQNRSRVITLLNEVCVEQCFRRETFHSAIAFLDYFLSKTKYCGSEDLSALAMTMVYIAAKLWEPLTPNVQELAAVLSDPEQKLYHMRKLEFMFFKLSPCCVPVIPTVYDWFRLFMHNIRVAEAVLAPSMSTPTSPSTTPAPQSPAPPSPTPFRPATPTLKRMSSLALTPTMMMEATTPTLLNQHFWSAQEQFYAQSGRHMCRTLKPSDVVMLMSFLDMLKAEPRYLDMPPSQLVAATLFVVFPRNAKDDRVAMALGIAKSSRSKLFDDVENDLAVYKQTLAVGVAEDESLEFFMQTRRELEFGKDLDVMERKDDARPVPASPHLNLESGDTLPQMEGEGCARVDDPYPEENDDDDVPDPHRHRADHEHHRLDAGHLLAESGGPEDERYDREFHTAVVNGSSIYEHVTGDDVAAAEEGGLTPAAVHDLENAPRSPTTLPVAGKASSQDQH